MMEKIEKGRGVFMGKFCAKCGKPVGQTDAFCQNCGAKLDENALAQEAAREEAMAQVRSSVGKKGCVGFFAVVLIAIVGIVILIFLGASVADQPVDTTKSIAESLSVSEEESLAVQSILQECGVVNAYEFKHDELLDNAHSDNETGYRVTAENAENVILYMNADNTVNMVRWNDVDLYKDGGVVTTIEQELNRPSLEVVSTSDETDGYVRYVVGEIRNNSTKTYGYVQVEIGLYQGETLVGSTLDNVNNLEPGQTWSFKAPVLEDSADNYKITGVTGY